MSNYSVTRTQLFKRLSSFRVDTKEANAIVGALFSYLHNVGLSFPPALPFTAQLIKLAYFDFKFLHYLYFNDQFLQDFVSVFRDYNNPSIEYSEDTNIYNRRIRDLIGIEDRQNGLYPYILQYKSKSLEQLKSTELEFLIVNSETEAFNTPSTKSKIDLFMKADFQARTDDKQSFTDSIAQVNSKINIDTDSMSMPDDYKLKTNDPLYDVPFMNGTPGSNSSSKKSNSSNAIQLDSVNVVNSYKKPVSSSQLERDTLSKYPVLNFLLNRSKRK